MKRTSLLVIVGILIVTLLMSMFTVKQWEQALVLRLGKAVRVENAPGQNDAGLKYRVPVLDKVISLDRRNLEIDLDPVELPASDQQRLVVDAFVRYKIVDAIRFYEAVRDERGAKLKLQSIMDSTLRDVLGRASQPEIISGRRAELMEEIQQLSNAFVQDQSLGIEVIDVRIIRADLPDENADRVFERMVSQRKQEAEKKRAEGRERALEIEATARKTATIIKAEAQQKAEIIRGTAEAEATKTYADAFNDDPDFYEFYRSMQSYRTGIQEGKTFVISPDSDFLRYLSDQKGRR